MTKNRDYQADFYSSFTPIQHRHKRINRALKIRWALEQYILKELSEATCVDVGCSAGIITAQLADIFGATVGVDYDRTGLAAIQPEDKLKAFFVRADAMRLPFADESLDVIICAQVYEHVPNDVALVNEIHRTLRPGGYCFFSGPNWLFPIELHYFLPFLHWLPEGWANQYLRLTQLGTAYYERSRTIWSLHRLLHQFEIRDIDLEVLLHFYLPKQPGPVGWLKFIPHFIWKLLIPLFPNFNLILLKPDP